MVSKRSSSSKTKKPQKKPKKGQFFYKNEVDPEQLDDYDATTAVKKERFKDVSYLDNDDTPKQKKTQSKGFKQPIEQDNDEDVDIDEETPYQKLMATLKGTGKHATLLKRRKMEEEGIEDDSDDYEEEEEDDFVEQSGVEEEVDAVDEEDDDDDEQEDQDVEDNNNDEDAESNHDSNNNNKDLEKEEVAEETDKLIQENELEAAGVEDDEQQDEFTQHFADKEVTVEEMEKRIKALKNETHSAEIPSFGHLLANADQLPQERSSLLQYKVKPRVATHWHSAVVQVPRQKKKYNKRNHNNDLHIEFNQELPLLSRDEGTHFTELQAKLFPYMNQYMDLFYSQQNLGNVEEIRQAYALHVLNHCLKSRDRVLKGNAKINSADASVKHTIEVKDQGFTRPKVLILLPFRHSALQIVQHLIQLAPKVEHSNIMNKRRFFSEFAEEEPSSASPSKPEEWQKIFQGNIDDHFRIGMSFNRNNIQLYSEFYAADVIMASPLGLRTALGAKGEKEYDYDFLSSIEMVIVDQMDILLTQNWDHVQYIFDHLNLLPRSSEHTDFSRVKEWYLTGCAKYYRQNLMFSSFITPEMNALWNRFCTNYAGKAKFRDMPEDGTISEVIPKVRQVFHRLNCSSIAQLGDFRFDYFVNEILAKIRNSVQSHILIYIPSYFDFVRLRNYFTKEEINFGRCCEYTKTPTVSRSRAYFVQGRVQFMLYTERFHFFHRYRIRGIHNIIFYGLPTYGHYYPELLNLLEGQEGNSVTVLYSKYDRLALERVVGVSRAARMIDGDKSTFMFC